ncbi:ATP-binding cassette domain-containing protein [Streptomyces sp. NBC_00996]|uniref:ATP-binding cassette domain-containing protein n=1 Tax=Streptomyces sp. NBC_00996 TaxID=2903710 RepID=UPI0038647F52|nr:ATP-binding cassette domain-containing protein [Streptomyces sp. NBC_00996]
MPTPMRPSPSAAAHGPLAPVDGLCVQTRRVSQQVRGAGRVLRDVSFDVGPGRLTVIAGSSGAGKTILLQTLAGLRAPAEGEVLHDGVQPGPPGPEFGLVPQEDIIHRELPLRRTLVSRRACACLRALRPRPSPRVWTGSWRSSACPVGPRRPCAH